MSYNRLSKPNENVLKFIKVVFQGYLGIIAVWKACQEIYLHKSGKYRTSLSKWMNNILHDVVLSNIF